MATPKTLRTCEKGHKFYKSSDCPTCPVCEKEKEPATAFLGLLSNPARNALLHYGIDTIHKLADYTEKEILDLHGIGKASLPAFRKALEEAGLGFKPTKEKVSRIIKNRKVNFNYSDFEVVKHIALAFPDTEESISHEGTPSVKVRNKLMCRLHESGEFIPIRLDYELRNKYLDSHPEIFHLPDHFKNYPYICMWIHNYDRKILSEILELSWKGLATKKQVKEYEERKENRQ